MTDIDIGTSLDDLLKASAEEVSAAYEAAVAVLTAQVANHTILLGPPLPAISKDLDPDQQRAVDAADRTLRVLAPAGAGKTHCIVNRVLNYLTTGVVPHRILLVTFDRNSANELRGRAHDLLPNAPIAEISTLNAFGRGILARHVWGSSHPQLINATPGYHIKLVKQYLKKIHDKGSKVRDVMPTGLQARYYLQLFSFLKNSLYSPRSPAGPEAIEAIARTLDPILETSAAPFVANVRGDKKRFLVLLAALDWLYRSTEADKERGGYIDFDDQKLLAYEAMEGEDGLAETIQRAYDHVIVDEFQDLNELDFRLILLVAKNASLTIVGDDDQAIYGFRGTSPRYIIDFAKLSGRPVQTIELRRNYRSPANIVSHAQALIRHNKYRVRKDPIAAREDECTIKVYNALTASAEAAMIGTYVEKLLRAGTPPREIAVLYRMNSQSLPLQLDLIGRDVRYYCRKQDNILGQEYLPRVVAALRYVAAGQSSSGSALEAFIETVKAYFWYLGGEDAKTLRECAGRTGPPFLDALEDKRLRKTKIGKSNVASALRELLMAKTPLEAMVTLGSKFKGVRGLIGSLEDAVDNQLPLGELGDVAMRFEAIGDFAEFLEASVERARSAHTEDYESDAVRLLTYFRSKGAQFDTVILPSLNEGIIPHGKAVLEDERRLFYVAVTRTRRNLWLSYVQRVCNKGVEVSRFLDELDLASESPPIHQS